jgi:predicted ATP-dependent endonuclease of OLD family
MLIETVYVRFFRSLNFDYLRKASTGYVSDPWDETPDGLDYPFVRVPLDARTTTVVGANESGKTQLLDAIKMCLTGEGIERRDFCRYSPFFSDQADLTLPEFGLGLSVDTDAQREIIRGICGLDQATEAEKAALFRMNGTPKLRMYLKEGDSWTMHHVQKPTGLVQLGLPSFFEIHADVPLPDSVPLEYLATGELSSETGLGHLRGQWSRLKAEANDWFSSAEKLRTSAEEVIKLVDAAKEPNDHTLKKYKLASNLLIQIAGLDRELFAELQRAVDEERNGYANSIVDKVNEELSNSLNFPHWWSQDRAFRLVVERNLDQLVFLIHDRTGKSYSFDERSEGLKYFLSYFVQSLSHTPPESGQPEILLMDEPDAYLSSSGQQDLLRIFASFAEPENENVDPIQVVYVTHSPFLIDKNHSERIRVLEKGEHDEGTRVVRNASRNHYEPLRSSLGGLVGETAFIGNCNLILEGASDQILIAGFSNLLTREGYAATERLDLNAITLVPAGGAPHVPYMVFLARGRDVDRPPVIVLIDGDKDGIEAKKVLKKGGPRHKPLIKDEYVAQLGERGLDSLETENPNGCRTIEDLIPLTLAMRAAQLYLAEFKDQDRLNGFVAEPSVIFKDGLDSHGGLQAALCDYLQDDEFHLDKVGFARCLLAAVNETTKDSEFRQVAQRNFERLLRLLAKMQRQVNREVSEERIRSRVNRARRRFRSDNPEAPRKEAVSVLIEEISGQLDSSPESDEVRSAMRRWIREFKLEEEPRARIDEYERFLSQLEALPYVGTLAVQQG